MEKFIRLSVLSLAVTATLNAGTVNVGNQIKINVPGAPSVNVSNDGNISVDGSNVSSEDKNEKGVTISGSSQTKTITVNGENILVTGSDNKITIKGNASMIIVSGSDNKIYVDSVAKITITGSNNKIYYKTSPTKSGKPSVSTSGSDNSVSKR